MKIHFSSWRGKTKFNFSSRISRDRDSCQGLTATYSIIRYHYDLVCKYFCEYLKMQSRVFQND